MSRTAETCMAWKFKNQSCKCMFMPRPFAWQEPTQAAPLPSCPLPGLTPTHPPTHPVSLLWVASIRPQWLRMMEGRMAAGMRHDPSSCVDSQTWSRPPDKVAGRWLAGHLAGWTELPDARRQMLKPSLLRWHFARGTVLAEPGVAGPAGWHILAYAGWHSLACYQARPPAALALTSAVPPRVVRADPVVRLLHLS